MNDPDVQSTRLQSKTLASQWHPPSYLYWVNPGELLAIAGDVRRSIDRELVKELLGYTITIKDEHGAPLVSITLGPNGEPISQTLWIDGKPGEAIPLDGE